MVLLTGTTSVTCRTSFYCPFRLTLSRLASWPDSCGAVTWPAAMVNLALHRPLPLTLFISLCHQELVCLGLDQAFHVRLAFPMYSIQIPESFIHFRCPLIGF